ncbi:CocE/NonD family hydrolase [Chitinophaga sp. SYP-B3965]|uniref:CocE/NonD family hydrolase n=1 Tax=Chitinophaga sp. SYP-B3965 TaxID=2663120 RepID=UPI001299ECDD|nr:CocE/NonD family hydrolase [Chitinophaga sp. SYP-B3965]MRG47906.1 CocE/NonD family hydrolase [Chitinophaga sp. SYP-B3965]
MRILTLFPVCLLLAITTYAQRSFRLTQNLNIRDTAAVRLEMQRLADSAYVFCKAKHFPMGMVSSAMLIRQEYEEAQKAFNILLKWPKDAKVLSPINLLQEMAAWPGKETEKLQERIKTVQKDFRADVISSLKGSFQPEYASLLRLNIVQQLEQIQKTGQDPNLNKIVEILQYQAIQDFLDKHYTSLQEALQRLEPTRFRKIVARIPMRDGVLLNAFIFQNEDVMEREPAIISLSPYPYGREAERGNIWALHGYNYVYIDNRGRRTSEGENFPYEKDAQDYYDIIDWVSLQRWCNGKVGTTGGSYLGFAQWQSIRKAYRHPALKAVNPAVAVGFGVDFPRNANMFTPYMLRWAEFVSGTEYNLAKFLDENFWYGKEMDMYRRHIPFAQFDSLAGLPNPFFRKWVSHPDYDDYWQGIMPNQEDYASLDIPMLTVTGYYDDDQNGAMFYYNNHHRYGGAVAQQNHQLLIGPFDHGGSQWMTNPIQSARAIEKQAQIAPYRYMIAWFNWILKDGPKPFWMKNKITYFAAGTGEWKGTTSFADLTKDTLRYYLTNTKKLQSQLPETQQSLVYQHDITSLQDSGRAYQSILPDRRNNDSIYSPQAILFETDPFPEDIQLSDRISATLYIRLNVPDADFSINFYEITKDNIRVYLGTAAIRCRYRFGGDQPKLMPLNSIEKLAFDNAYIYLKKIRKGSRIRMEFGSVNHPSIEKNYGFGGIVARETTSAPRLIEATIITDKDHPSSINIPITD